MATTKFKVGDVFQIDDESIYVVKAIVAFEGRFHYVCGTIIETQSDQVGIPQMFYDDTTSFTLTYLTHCEDYDE